MFIKFILDCGIVELQTVFSGAQSVALRLGIVKTCRPIIALRHYGRFQLVQHITIAYFITLIIQVDEIFKKISA